MCDLSISRTRMSGKKEIMWIHSPEKGIRTPRGGRPLRILSSQREPRQTMLCVAMATEVSPGFPTHTHTSSCNNQVSWAWRTWFILSTLEIMAFAHNLTYCKCHDCGEKISITLIRVSKKHSLDAQHVIILAIVRTTLTILHRELQEWLEDHKTHPGHSKIKRNYIVH